jgi:hypothetical protein
MKPPRRGTRRATRQGMTSQITTLEALPETITADTEVCIPGYHIEPTRTRDHWVLVHTDTDVSIKPLTVQW